MLYYNIWPNNSYPEIRGYTHTHTHILTEVGCMYFLLVTFLKQTQYFTIIFILHNCAAVYQTFLTSADTA